MKIVRRKRMSDETGHNIWRSYSDMMSGLLLLFVLIMAVSLMQAQKNYNDKLAEAASRAATQDQLEQTQVELNQRESELEQKTMTLSDLQNALEAQASQLTASQERIAQQESELEASRSQLSSQKTELEASQMQLAQQESELASRDAALAASQKELDSSQAKLDEQKSLLAQQQAKIDQIIGVKADLIEELNEEFQANQINVDIDSQTGAIVLDSNVLFDFGEAELTRSGRRILRQVLPVYCQVLLSKEYADYVGEVIIDGYTDSIGTYLNNLELSQARAFAVAAYLIQDSGTFLTADQSEQLSQKLTANGRSQSNLILDENGREDAEASRRVEIKFRLKDEEMIAELSQLISATKIAETELESVTVH